MARINMLRVLKSTALAKYVAAQRNKYNRDERGKHLTGQVGQAGNSGGGAEMLPCIAGRGLIEVLIFNCVQG